MNAVDIVLLALGGYFVVRGFMRGLTGEFFSLLGVVGSFYCSMAYCAPLSHYISTKWDINPLVTTTIAIVVIFLAVLLFCAVMGKQVRKLLKITKLSRLDTILGGVTGFLKIFLIVLAILVVGVIVFPFTGNGWLRDSKVLMTTARILPVVYPPLEERGFVPNLEELRQDAVEFILSRSLSVLTEKVSADVEPQKTSDDLRREKERTESDERRLQQLETLAQKLGLLETRSGDKKPDDKTYRQRVLEYFLGPENDPKIDDESEDE